MIFERGYFDDNLVNESEITKSLDNIRNFNASSEYSSRPTVFISHKHDDLKDLRGVIGLFEKYGAKVYIDSMDNKMPKQTSGDTAARIKDVIKFCKKFVLLATEKAIESYWCNWELGIGDTYRFKNHIAILPMKDKGTSDYNYKGNEYLQIYNQIHYRNTSGYNLWGEYITSGFYVQDSNRKDGKTYITPIEDWLNQ
ncbi:toll/interleukin-1 receptor domain-containing protein [Draconibacterium sp. IB214405]|uniref:toll/interleukin-1 receptor domain-containing protein n=1 Tax=Draconibacterium sp. IB214405 TaxID=3097352 RepID=UPI002A176F6C|nr:toll/interleukin-1 receptor domain-containing protein [Draconibacterium sp. IB214405]MDX8338832.1 toll/interleukin-1 receptor domain-containing protein [Draconibacterium sp. IB214405]